MNWNKNPPPPGVNPSYSSFNYNSTGYSLEQPRPAQPANDYSHTPGRPGGGWDQADEPVLRKPGPALFRQEDHAPFKADTRPAMHSGPPAHVPEPSSLSSYSSSQINPSSVPAPEGKHFDRKPGLAVSEQPGVYEKILVEEITTPGGVRPRPPDKDLHEFVNKCKYLPSEIIVPLLVILIDNPQRVFVI